ncbi:hypothetical protein GDO78_010301 [Eleutherodactylus coqui]|uniref:Uncharacterized protein n=1 Tax=Eleutherodactylus coqui TaxID=57060 RepID=A0A8J6F4H8_ELECQ|nr:hypothetical protein GDO78_010301 [Eleutherodactylus coqui]
MFQGPGPCNPWLLSLEAPSLLPQAAFPLSSPPPGVSSPLSSPINARCLRLMPASLCSPEDHCTSAEDRRTTDTDRRHLSCDGRSAETDWR